MFFSKSPNITLYNYIWIYSLQFNWNGGRLEFRVRKLHLPSWLFTALLSTNEMTQFSVYMCNTTERVLSLIIKLTIHRK